MSYIGKRIVDDGDEVLVDNILGECALLRDQNALLLPWSDNTRVQLTQCTPPQSGSSTRFLSSTRLSFCCPRTAGLWPHLTVWRRLTQTALSLA
jgi:hypothetical protein